MNFYIIILLWQHILYLCTLFLVQGGKWTGQSTCLPVPLSCNPGTLTSWNPLGHSRPVTGLLTTLRGAWRGVVVKALRSDGPGIDSRWCHWIFQ